MRTLSLVRFFGLVATLALPASVAAQRLPNRVVTARHWTFEVPGDWQDVPITTASVVAHAREPRMRGGLPVNVNLNVETYAGTPIEYATAAVQGLRGIGRVETQRGVTLGGYPGLLVTTAWRGGAVPYRTLQFITARDGSGYVLTCTASIAAWNNARSTCMASINSFRPTDR